ncbi:MAG: hypothetical protein Kow0031_23010 [Anaerolineae bacterium]
MNTATISNISTAGNSWGGVALYTYGRYYPGGSSNITLTGTNSFAESNPLYVQLANFTTPTSPYPLTNFTQSDFSHTVKNNTSVPNYTLYRLSASQAITAALALAAPQDSYINTLADGSFLVGHTTAASMTIQAAVNAAAPGDVINVLPGVYPENVVINKAVTLRGAGSGTDPAQHTILDGSTLGAASGIHLNSGVTNVTLEELTVQNYSTTGSTAGIYAALGNNNFTAQRLYLLNNTGGRAGLHINGPVDTVLIDHVTAYSNTTRGIVIWNGHKTGITLTNNDARYNNCCGIELQDGTASGVTITGNTVMGNLDSGLSAIGLMGGAGPNLIANNVISGNGRFGLEIKNPNGTGLNSGDGSIVVENNTVSFTPSAGMNSRDHAGIAVFRRSFQSGNPNGYVDVPSGVVVRNNTVSGYRQQNPASSESEGFGIVLEGISHTVAANTAQFNDIGLQIQGGAHPNANYVPNDAGDGDQADGQSPDYFGRGNAPVANVLLAGNFVSSNTVGIRTVGVVTASINANYVYSNTQVGLLALESSANINAEGDNQFCDNGLYGLENRGAANLNAANNWWGAADGPGPAGSGDVVTGTVTVIPFASQAATGPCAGAAPAPENNFYYLPVVVKNS